MLDFNHVFLNKRNSIAEHRERSSCNKAVTLQMSSVKHFHFQVTLTMLYVVIIFKLCAKFTVSSKHAILKQLWVDCRCTSCYIDREIFLVAKLLFILGIWSW